MLPVHPTLLHPRTGLPMIAVGYRANGRPIWPVMGGNGEGEGEAGAGAGEGAGGGESGKPAGGTDASFPADTPLTEMTTEQQLAYWKHQSRKHETTVKARGDYDQLKEKAAAHDALQEELRTDQEKQINAATEAGKAAARAELAPQLVEAKFEALAAGRQVNGKPLNIEAIVSGLDPARFLDAAGKADAAKVTAFLDGIAPVSTVRPGPSSHGAGPRGNEGGALTGKEAGKAEAEKRFGAGKTTTTLTPSR